jgi:hypothetical protein
MFRHWDDPAFQTDISGLGPLIFLTLAGLFLIIKNRGKGGAAGLGVYLAAGGALGILGRLGGLASIF